MKPWNFQKCYGTDFVHTASAFQLLYSSVEIQHSAVPGSQLSLALSKLAFIYALA